ncbi:MAG: hypothetical protein WCJ30_00150 [Deltaproteobacteria bacterium]
MALATTPGAALAQQSSAPDPGRVVDDALGRDRAETRRAVHHAGGAHDWRVPLLTRRGVCYEILAQASGTSRVSVTLLARRARVAEPFSIATTAVARSRFCASLPGAVYSAMVHAEGPANWALALRAAPAGEPRSAASAAPIASSAPPASVAPTASAAPTLPIGGVEADFVGQQIRAAVQGRSPRAIVAALRVELGTNQAYTVDLPLVAAHCVLAVAAAVPSASDVNLQIDDPAGNRVGEDAGHRGVETLSYCPPYSGTYRLQVRMFGGHGLTGIQAFEVR